MLAKCNGAMIFDPVREVSLWARRRDFSSIPQGAISSPELLQFAPVSFQVIRRNNQDWASNVTILQGFVPSVTLAGVLSQSQGKYFITPCSETKRTANKQVRIPVSATKFSPRPGFCQFSTLVGADSQVTALAIAPLDSIDPSSHAPESHIKWFQQKHSANVIVVDARHPQIAELGGTSLPDIAQASSFLRSHGSAIIAPETRQAREWLEAIAGVDSQVGVVIPLHEHTIPEFPDTPNEIIGSLPSDVRRRLILEIRFSPTPAVVSNPAICGATTSHQCFRWALARFGEAGVGWAGPTLDCPLEGLAMAIPRGAPNVDSAAAYAFRQIEHARVEHVCGFSSPRHTFVEVFGLDQETTRVVSAFPEARRDFLVESLPWLFQSDEGWSFYFQRALSFGDFAPPSIFGRSFPISNTHLRSRGLHGLNPDDVLALVRARNRGVPANPVVAIFDHKTKRHYTTCNIRPAVVIRQTKEVAVVCGFPKHLTLHRRAAILQQIIPSVRPTDCWLGHHPTRTELRSGCFFTPPEAWLQSNTVEQAKQTLFNLGLTLLHPAPAHSKRRHAPNPQSPEPPRSMPSLPIAAEKLAALHKIFANAGVELPAHLAQGRATNQPARPTRPRSGRTPSVPRGFGNQQERNEPPPPRNEGASHQPNPTGGEDVTGHKPGSPSPEVWGDVTFHPAPTQQTSLLGPPVGALTDTATSKSVPITTRFYSEDGKRRKLHQRTLFQCLSQETPRTPQTLNSLRQELRDRQSPRFTKEVGVVAGIHKSPPGPLQGRLQRSMRKTEEILPLQGLRSPDHQCIWGGCRDLSVRFDEEHQVPSLGTRGGQNPSPQGRVCLHNIRRWKRPLPLFSDPRPREARRIPEERFPEENLPQGLRELEQFRPPEHPPLFRVPCPKNGHCLFYAMAFLDDLLSLTLTEEIGAVISEDEEHLLATSSASESSSDASYR